MSGPGAEYTPFSKLFNIVVIAEIKEGVLQHDHEAAVRMIGFKAAAYLAEAGRNIEPCKVVTYEHLPFIDSAKK
jgi:glycine reductase